MCTIGIQHGAIPRSKAAQRQQALPPRGGRRRPLIRSDSDVCLCGRSRNLEERVDFYAHTQGQLGDADGGARVFPRISEYLHQQVGDAVGNFRLIRECVRGAHEDIELDAAPDAIKVAKYGLQLRQDVQSAKTRSLLSLFNRDFLPQPAKIGERSKAKPDQEGEPTRESLRPEVLDINGTIACVSGFIVNLPEGNVRLVSPTRACEEFPTGYRTIAEAGFGSAEEFGSVIDWMVRDHTYPNLSGSRRVRFRKDLKFTQRDDGFSLKNRSWTGDWKTPEEWVARLAQRVNQASFTVAEMVSSLAAEGLDAFSVMSGLEEFYQAGLIEDV